MAGKHDMNLTIEVALLQSGERKLNLLLPEPQGTNSVRFIHLWISYTSFQSFLGTGKIKVKAKR